MKEVKLFLNHAGFCYSKRSHVIKGGDNKESKFYSLFGLIFHPEFGWMLYDTGYTDRFYAATRKYPNKIYSRITKVVVTQADEIKSQLNQFNLVPEDIKHIFISHFHADHIGGLKDFNSATFYCSKAAFIHLNKISSFLGFTRGILKDLIPSDFTSRLKFIEDISTRIKDDIFGEKYDLFGDQSLIFYRLHGHAAGQIGMQIRTSKRSYFLIADACWVSKTYIKMVLPPFFVSLFFDSWKDFKESLKKINRFHRKHPEVIIVPSHCSETTMNLISNQYDINAL